MFSLEKYDAAHRSAVVFDGSSRGKILVTGTDRASFLHGLLTNDITALKPGTGCYSAYLTPQGRMVADMRVIETGDRMVLDVEGFVAARLAERFEQLIFSEDAQARNVSGELAEFGVHGPLAPILIEQATGIPSATLRSMADYDNLGTRWADGAADLIGVRDAQYRLPGFDFYVSDAGSAERLAAACVAAGALAGDDEIAETLRVEAGRPRFGVDMDTDTIPLEAGIEERAISFTKGCYVGQEVIVRVQDRGHGRVARRLVGLTFDASASVPMRNAAIHAGNREIGRVTSAAW